MPGTDGALALALMHELIVNDWLDHDYIERHVDGWAGAARARARVAARARGRGVRPHGGADRATSRALRHHASRPRSALNYGMQRVRGGGNAMRADRAACRAWSAPGATARAACCCRRRLVPPFRNRRWSGPTCWPRHAAHHQHEHDRRRPAARDRRDAARRPRFGPRIEALVVYNSNPVAVAPESRARCARASRATTCSPWCSSTS